MRANVTRSWESWRSWEAGGEKSAIFDRFYWVDSDRFRRGGCSGTGLPITQAIAPSRLRVITV